ncbi:MAG: peptide chain release factor 3 [Chloroflexi bacterium]|nr:MAG: peptide chain release factor 3 [Chloroflexota bacterium]
MATLPAPSALSAAIDARRTFAIISHPDAGKTTLTEKLLLYGNAIHLAGSVRARRNQRNTRSDWMSIERERGISISSTVLQFPYRDCVINLLDTPGHQDFSEDTYRTLMAADCAVMVLDAAKGVEPQTRKLFEVCRRRQLPVFTFINKMDRPALDPLELLDEVERVLGMQPVPLNWPIGDGPEFRGVVDRRTRNVHLYDRTMHNQKISPESIHPLADGRLQTMIGATAFTELTNTLEMLDTLELEFDPHATRQGRQTPVFFGSALTNFGVQMFLDAFVDNAPPPAAYLTESGVVDPHDTPFTGFIFKIQANMNPRHRDSVAFVRVCSGRFERNMEVWHAQTERTLRLPRPYKFFAEDREVLEEAYAGDIIGLPNNGFSIGDTLSTGAGLRFATLPRFQPEFFQRLLNTDISRQKQFQRGLAQLESEGAMQVLYETDSLRRAPILAVVGMLQLDVVCARLEEEYGVPTTLEPCDYTLARWLVGTEAAIDELPWRHGLLRTKDQTGRLVALLRSAFTLHHLQDKHPAVEFHLLDELG